MSAYTKLKRFGSPFFSSFFLLGCAQTGAVLSDSQTYKVASAADYVALRNHHFKGGEKVLFKRGESFSGSFSPNRDSFDGTSKDIITLSAYGDPDLPLPKLIGGGVNTGTILIENSGGWIIENLHVENEASNEKMRVGIYILSEDSGLHNTIQIRNNVIQNVSGIHNNKDNGGIVVRVYGTKRETAYKDLLIENNQISFISGIGLRIKSTWEGNINTFEETGKMAGRYAFQDVTVRGNIVHDTTRNAIIVGSSDSPLIEYNRVGPNISTRDTGNAIFNFATIDAVIQYNEAYGNSGEFTDKERGGIDADFNSVNTVIQYNYTHDNHYAYAIMRRPNNGVTIRYNISQNERYGFLRYGFPGETGLDNVLVHNNTVHSDNDNMSLILQNDGKERNPINTRFVNNIFHFTGEDPQLGFDPETGGYGNSADTNLFYGLEGFGENALTSAPLLLNPGSGKVNIDFRDTSLLEGYKLCAGSPAIGSGKQIEAENKDLWGTLVETDFVNIGAYEGSGLDCPDQ